MDQIAGGHVLVIVIGHGVDMGVEGVPKPLGHALGGVGRGPTAKIGKQAVQHREQQERNAAENQMLGKVIPPAKPFHQLEDGLRDMGIHAPDHVIQREAGHKGREIYADSRQQHEEGGQDQMPPVRFQHLKEQAPGGSLSFCVCCICH